MRRRALCRSLVAGAALLAGCSRRPGDQLGANHRPPQTEPGEPTVDESTPTTVPTTADPGRGLSVGLETDETEDAFLVTAVVANNRETAVDVVLVASWSLDDRHEQGTRRVRLAAGETGRYEFTFPAFGSVSFSWRTTGSTTPDGGSRRAPRRSRR